VFSSIFVPCWECVPCFSTLLTYLTRNCFDCYPIDDLASLVLRRFFLKILDFSRDQLDLLGSLPMLSGLVKTHFLARVEMGFGF
jgi:hypothetical protein